MHEFVIDTLHKGLLAERKSRFRRMKTYWDKEYTDVPEWQAMLMTNQQAHLREITDTSSNQAFYSMVMSTVRRMYAKLISHQLVSVQPIDYPSAMVFYFSQEMTTTGSTFHDMIESHYNNDNYDVSLGSYVWVSGSPIQLEETAFSGIAMNIPYNGGSSGLSSLEILTDGAVSSTYDIPLGFTISPQTWSKDLFSGNQINVHFTEIDGNPSVDFLAGPIGISRWKQYIDQEATSGMQQVKLLVTGKTVTAKSRKLKISWTQELEQNLQSLFMINAEDELSELMACEIAAEMDREIVRDLIILAPYKSYWYYDRTITAHTAESMFNGEPLDYGIDASDKITQYEHEQTLLTKINQMSGIIRKKNVYHEANWIVCSTKVGAVIEGMKEFSPHIHVTPKDVLAISGRLNGRYNVFIDPNLPDEICLVGYKGDGWDAGYILAPYIPLEFSPAVSDPNDLFTLYKNAMTRYGKCVVSNKKYGLIICTFPSWYNPVNGD